MSTNLTVVVAGIPPLAAALNGSGQFARVVEVSSTSGLKTLLQSGELSAGIGDKVFMFADTTIVDTPQTLPVLLGKLTAMGAPVIIVERSPAARDLVVKCPGAGLLQGPLKLNQVLGAISGFPGMDPLPPVANNVTIPLVDEADATPVRGSQPPAPSAAPAFARPSAAPAAPAVPVAQPAPAPATPAVRPPSAPSTPPAFAAPAAESVPASPAFAPRTPAAPPATVPPASPAFGRPASDAAPAPAFGSPAASEGTAPAAQPSLPRRRSLSDAAGSTPAATTSPASPPAPRNPFGAPADAPAPRSPFGAPTAQDTPAPRNPFGGSPAPAPAARNPFSGDAPAPRTPFAPVAAPQSAAAPSWGQPGMPAARAGQQGPVRPTRHARVITVTAPKGGTGKSTLSLNLAAYLGLRLRGTGKNVCIIDANVQQADTGKYLNAFIPNIEGILKDVTTIHPDRINSHLLHKPELNLSVLLGPPSPETANPLFFTGKRYTQILEALRPNYDYIIIDTPVAELFHDIFREFALPEADFIVTTIAPNVATLMNTDSWLQQITLARNAGGMGIDPEKIGVVLNRAQDDIGMSEEEVRRELGRWRFLGSIPETKEWQRCNNLHQLVATKNYHELNQAFSLVLSAATQEEMLATTPNALPASSNRGGLLKKFFGSRG